MSEAARRIYVAEPPPRYQALTPVVADSSAVCALLFEEAERDLAGQRLAGHELHAPALLDHEFASVALKKHRQGWPAESIAAALEAYRVQPLVLHRADIEGHMRVGTAVRIVGLRRRLPVAGGRVEGAPGDLRPSPR